MTDRWYSRTEPLDALTQGDLIWDCPVVTWSNDASRQPPGTDKDQLRGLQESIACDVVVMTQACDLENDKIDDVILCAHCGILEYRAMFEADQLEFGQIPTVKSWKKHCDDVRNGTYWSRSILNAETDDGYEVDHRIVFFDQVYTLPRIFIETLLRNEQLHRVRLNPPYREHLSQAFARYFMRVGLPVGVERSWA